MLLDFPGPGATPPLTLGVEIAGGSARELSAECGTPRDGGRPRTVRVKPRPEGEISQYASSVACDSAPRSNWLTSSRHASSPSPADRTPSAVRAYPKTRLRLFSNSPRLGCRARVRGFSDELQVEIDVRAAPSNFFRTMPLFYPHRLGQSGTHNSVSGKSRNKTVASSVSCEAVSGPSGRRWLRHGSDSESFHPPESASNL